MRDWAGESTAVERIGGVHASQAFSVTEDPDRSGAHLSWRSGPVVRKGEARARGQGWHRSASGEAGSPASGAVDTVWLKVGEISGAGQLQDAAGAGGSHLRGGRGLPC